MPQILITAGNVFDPTFDGVCYAVGKKLGGVNAIHIFDTVESAEQAESAKRGSRIRNLLGPIDISTSLIDDNNRQFVIPERLARLIRNHGVEEIIVDLSNGQKITVSVLYAVSTISRIPNIYALEFRTRVTKDTRITDLVCPDEWDYVRIEPLKEILNITQSSFVELVYYRDRIETITAMLAQRNPPFTSDVKDKLEITLVDYFTVSMQDSRTSERLARCINGLGKIIEDVSKIWHDCCNYKQLIETRADDFYSRAKQIISRWEKFRNAASIGKLDVDDQTIAQIVVPTLGVDAQLDVMRIYRNFASHSTSYYKFSRHDARLALDSTLLILERVAASHVLTMSEMENQDDQQEIHSN